MIIMIMNNRLVISLVISLLLFIENGEAGWKFWKKDKETTTTTTTITSNSVNVQPTVTPIKARESAMPAINTGAAVITVNPRVDIGTSTTGENIQNNVRFSRPNTDLRSTTEATNQFAASHTSTTSQPGLRSRNTPQSPPQSAPRPTSMKPQQSLIMPGPTATPSTTVDQNRLGMPSSSNRKMWADVVASGSGSASPTGPPRQPEYPRHPVSDENGRKATSANPIRSSQSNQSTSRQPESTTANAVSSLAVGTIDRVSDSTGKVYSSNPTYSKGNIVTDEDLEKLSEALYIKETNNAHRYITSNLQKQTTSSSPVDQASQPLLTVSPEAFQIPTIQKVFSIFDNYQLDTRTNEYISPAQRQEESLLVDTFLSTNVMSAAMRFLADKGFVRQDYYEYKDVLRRIWFNLFSRGQGKIGSSGFEHVFMAETKQIDSDIEVLGLHNWIYFNVEEVKRHVDYLGYIKKVDLGNKGFIIKIHVKFNDHDKPVTTMFIGTSPELEMALYTVCFYARPDKKCPVSLGGTKFNIITHKFRYRGKDLIGTAYPEI